MLPKESQPANPPKEELPVRGINQFGTGLSSTLLSSQRTTTHRPETPHRGAPDPGYFVQPPAALAPGTFTTLPGGFCRVKPVFRGLSCANPFAGHHYSTGSRRALRGFRQDGRCGLPHARPFPCRPMNLTRSAPPHQIRLAANPGHRPVQTPMEYPIRPWAHSRAPAFQVFRLFRPFRAGREKVTRPAD